MTRNRGKKIDVVVPALLRWFSSNARDLPWRRTGDPYAIWVSEIMLQQTQVKTVIPYWERWMRALPTLQTLADADQQTIHKLWEGLGYYTRVRNLQKAAREIIAQHGGHFPKTYEALLELPGIGPYTAGAICSIAFNQPQPILDGNVIRVLTRVFGIAGNPREKATNQKLWRLARELVMTADSFKFQVSSFKLPAVKMVLERTSAFTPTLSPRRGRSIGNRGVFTTGGVFANLVPPPADPPSTIPQSAIRDPQFRTCSHLNQSLMELGALLCTPKQPQCPRCPLRTDCRAFRAGRVAHYPNLGARTTATTRHFAAFVIQHRNRFLVRQRPAGQVNAHLWEFPNLEITDGPNDLAESARAHFGISLTHLVQLRTIKHTITRYRITLQVWRGKANQAAQSKSETPRHWLTMEQLNPLPFTSTHRKIVDELSAALE